LRIVVAEAVAEAAVEVVRKRQKPWWKLRKRSGFKNLVKNITEAELSI
jgi:hypothetical protein